MYLLSSWVGTMINSRKPVTLCGWGVKAGMVHVWMALCDPLVTRGPYLRYSIKRRYINSRHFTLLYNLCTRLSDLVNSAWPSLCGLAQCLTAKQTHYSILRLLYLYSHSTEWPRKNCTKFNAPSFHNRVQ